MHHRDEGAPARDSEGLGAVILWRGGGRKPGNSRAVPLGVAVGGEHRVGLDSSGKGLHP